MWPLCISYRVLNAATETFAFNIPKYQERVEEFGNFNGTIFRIMLNNRQGYYQISVQKIPIQTGILHTR